MLVIYHEYSIKLWNILLKKYSFYTRGVQNIKGEISLSSKNVDEATLIEKKVFIVEIFTFEANNLVF